MAKKEYIEREALIDFCKKIIHDRWNETTAPVSWSHAYADFIDDINNQPTADVAPVRHGHWETISDSDMSKTVMCSVCNKMFYFTKKGQLNIDMMPYCPNCGARMDGDADANGNDNKTPET